MPHFQTQQHCYLDVVGARRFGETEVVMQHGWTWAACLAGAVAAGSVGCGNDGDDDGKPNAIAPGDLDASRPDAALDGGTLPPGMMAVSLRFKGKIGHEDLVCDQRYPALGMTKIAGKAQDFRFFVHNVRLISESGAEVPVLLDDEPPFQDKDLALLDFTDGRGSCTTGSPKSNMVIHGAVPVGRYTGIAFTTGVPEALNHTDPADAPPPLKAPGVQWSWLQGYRFLLAELNVNEGVQASMADAGPASADAGSTGGSGGHGGNVARPGLVFAHLGSTGCGGSIGAFTCLRPNRSEIKLTGFDPATSVVLADLGALFDSADLRGVLQCHGDGDPCTPSYRALGIDPATGASVPGQRVYRVE